MLDVEPIENPIYKMYVFVRTDIDYVHQAVQAGHAVAEYLIEHGKPTIWSNGILIYLDGGDELDLIHIERSMKIKGSKFSSFYEPDWGTEPQLTAIATIDKEGAFPAMCTIKMDTLFKKIKRKIGSFFR